ncbi:MAG: hypothetical protein AB1938_21850 [Myxococcota bacterium]
MRCASTRLWWLAAAVVAGCASPGGEPGKKVIGPGGGTVSDRGGASVEIPRGALAEDTLIEVQTLTDAAQLSRPARPLLTFGSGARLLPTGTRFAVPVTLKLPPAGHAAGAQVPVFSFDEAARAWRQEALEAQISSNASVAVVQVDHFTDFLLPGTARRAELAILDRFLEKPELPMQLRLQQLADFITQNLVTLGRKLAGTAPDKPTVECFEVVGLELRAFEGDQNAPPAVYVEGRKGAVEMVVYILPVDLQLRWQGEVSVYVAELWVIVHSDCAKPELTASADHPVLEVGESTSVRGALTCAGEPLPGVPVSCSLTGPGQLGEAGPTDAEGKLATSYSATAKGVATVTLMAPVCTEWTPMTAEASTSISVREKDQPLRWRLAFSSYGRYEHHNPIGMEWKNTLTGSLTLTSSDPACAALAKNWLGAGADTSRITACGIGSASMGGSASELFPEPDYRCDLVQLGFNAFTVRAYGYEAQGRLHLALSVGEEVLAGRYHPCSYRIHCCNLGQCSLDPPACDGPGKNCEGADCCHTDEADDPRHSDCGAGWLLDSIGITQPTALPYHLVLDARDGATASASGIHDEYFDDGAWSVTLTALSE